MEETLEKRSLVAYFERVRQKQKSEGRYDPTINKEVAYGGGGKIPSQRVVRYRTSNESDLLEKWGPFYYGMDEFENGGE